MGLTLFWGSTCETQTVAKEGLRDEDYVAYLDESGENGLQVVSGLIIPARWLRGAERRWRDFIRASLDSRSGKLEVKGRDLMKGNGASIRAQRVQLAAGQNLSATAAGRQFYRYALEHIALINQIRVLTVGLPTNQPLEVYRLWFWMANALLVEKPRGPRPKLSLTVIDGEDAAFRGAQDLIAHRFYHAFPKCQPYVARGSQWFVGGSAHQDSRLHPLIQMADLVAGVARHSIAGRQPQAGWYGKHLVGRAERAKRRIDASPRALARLKSLSQSDSCGSGWRDALLPS
jgi:uncharacterized protein DUF3800